jgi:micrococcal nuclease
MKKYFLALGLCLTMPLTNAFGFNSQAIITKIKDGDTIEVLKNSKTFIIRFACLDAPEKKQTFNGRNIGTEAMLRLQKILQINDVVDVLPYYKDRYGRIVAYVYKNGVNLNHDALKNGYGYAYKKYCSKDEITMEQTAKNNKKGLWAYGEYTNPYDFRHKKQAKNNQ